jgi:hypothetical protein
LITSSCEGLSPPTRSGGSKCNYQIALLSRSSISFSPSCPKWTGERTSGARGSSLITEKFLPSSPTRAELLRVAPGREATGHGFMGREILTAILKCNNQSAAIKAVVIPFRTLEPLGNGEICLFVLNGSGNIFFHSSLLGVDRPPGKRSLMTF